MTCPRGIDALIPTTLTTGTATVVALPAAPQPVDDGGITISPPMTACLLAVLDDVASGRPSTDTPRLAAALAALLRTGPTATGRPRE